VSIDPAAPPPLDPAGMMAHQQAAAQRGIGRLERRLFRMQAAPWHYLGDPGEPALVSPWAPLVHPTNGLDKPGFFKDPQGIVHLRGTVEATAGGAFTIFTLPALFRPGGHGCYFTGGDTAAKLFKVNWDGNVLVAGLPAGTVISLASAHFVARPPTVDQVAP
jgi:hypothetical protein